MKRADTKSGTTELMACYRKIANKFPWSSRRNNRRNQSHLHPQSQLQIQSLQNRQAGISIRKRFINNFSSDLWFSISHIRGFCEIESEFGGKTKAGASKTTKAAKTTSVNANLPAGGVNLLTPATTAQTTYYKAGDKVTFGWNYTSLSIPPHAVDVYVTCAANSATYTISNNMTYHSSAKVVWDTAPETVGENPLLTDHYTLVVYDAAKDPTQAASAGYLGAYNQYQFPLYTPRPYQNRTGM